MSTNQEILELVPVIECSKLSKTLQVHIDNFYEQ